MKKYAGLFLILAFFLTACSANFSFSGKPDDIIFGTGTLKGGIKEKKKTFSPDEDFLFETKLSNSFETTEVTMMILHTENGREEIYEDWLESVDPSWDEYLSEFQDVEENGAFDKGKYTVRMFNKESELIAEGTFSIK